MAVIEWTNELQKELDYLKSAIATDGDICPMCKQHKVEYHHPVTFTDDLDIGCCELCFDILLDYTQRQWDGKVSTRWMQRHKVEINNAWKEYHLHLREYNVTYRGVIIGE